jgi:DNA repair protein RadC
VPFVPLNADTPARRRGFHPLTEEPAPRRGFTPLGQAAPIVPAELLSPANSTVETAAARPASFDGLRPDGSAKGDGWLGRLTRPDGRVSTELSVGIDFDGAETLIPLLVPTLSADEQRWLLENDPDPKSIPEPIMAKAVAHARDRMAAGLSPFKDVALPSQPGAEASAIDPGWWERVAAGFKSHEGLGQNIGDLLGDRIPRINPASGAMLTLDERRGDRLAVEARRRDALGIPDAAGLGDLSADVLGAIAKEATDPLALMTGAYGAGARGLERVLKLAGAGGAYEGVAALAEQLSDAGEVTSATEIALRAGAGAVLTPALDAAIRGIGTGIKRLLARRGEPEVDSAAVDEEIREGIRAAAEEADAAGVDRELVVQRLFEIVQTEEGDIAVPRRDVFDAGETPALPEPKRGFTPVTDAPSATGPTPGLAAATPPPRANAAQLADEYERLARATTDATVRTELLQKAAASRSEAQGQAPKLSPRERSEKARRVNPAEDALDVAIRKLGGIDTAIETDWTGRLLDVPRLFGLPALERPGKGRTLDALAERLYELGYLDSFDQSELAALLARVERGETVLSREAGTGRLDREIAQQTDRDFRFEREPVGPEDSDTDFVIDLDDGTVVPARLVDLEDLRRLEEDENNAARFFEQEGAGAADEPGGLPGARDDGFSERLAIPLAGRPGDQPGPSEALLRSYDAAELRGDAERRAQLDADEAARTRAAEARAAADRERDAFALTGSTRSADANPAQRDLADYTQETREPGTPDVQQPAGPRYRAGADRRGGDAVPEQQLELFARDGDDTSESVAAFESLGSRVRYTGTSRLATGHRRVSDAADVAHVVAQLRKEPQESVLAVVTDAAGNILRVARHTVGTRDASQVDAGLLAAVAHSTPGARKVWFVHQHPSGNVRQGDADRAVTGRLHELLRDTGIEPQGMVVVVPGGRYSHTHPDPARSTVDTGAPIPSAARRESVAIEERRFQRIGRGGTPVSSAAEMRKALEAIAGRREGILLLDTQHVPVGFLPMSPSDMTKLRQGDSSPAGALFRALDESNASATAAIIESPDMSLLERVHSNFGAFASLASRRHLDTLNADGISASETGLMSSSSTFYANPFGEALKFGARSLRNNTAAAVPGGLAGGMGGGILSDEEPGSARWWTDVGFGALAGALGSAGLFGAARRANIIGEGSLADRGVDLAGRFLGKLLGRGPAELEEMKRVQRLMRELLDRQTGEIGTFLRDRFTPSERALMADLIEGRGIVPDLNRVHTQAKALDDYLAFVTTRMKEYGMLPPDIEEGGYLHRYYAKHLGLDKTFQEAKRQSLSGSYTIARGMVDTFGREYMSPGAATIVDEVESLLAEKSLLERGLFEKATGVRNARGPDTPAAGALPDEALLRPPPGSVDGQPATPEMTVDDAARRMAAIDERLAELRKLELVEMVGEQNGRVRSFFFTPDEVGRVESGTDPILARLYRQATPAPAPRTPPPALEGPLLTSPPGRVSGDPTAAPPGPATAAAPGPPRIEELSPTERVWQVKATDKDGVKLKRDWTRRERDSWGEIRDAGYRFVRGMAEASHDLSLGKLFRDVSKRADWVSSEAKVTKEGEWVEVPRMKARPGAGLERYGALAGKWVRPDVWRAMKRHGAAPRVLGALGDKHLPGAGATVLEVYRGALNRWKVWHTVYNPVTHFNNSYSNVEMLYMGGYGPADLATGLRELARGEQSALWREARDAGALNTDFGTATLREGGRASPLEDLAEGLRLQRDDVDATFAVDTLMRAKEWWIQSRNAIDEADGAWSTGLELARAAGKPIAKGLSFLKKPVDVAARSMQRAYSFEDNVFKMAVFAAERKAGKSVEHARRVAQELFFDYSDLPDAVKFVRDFPIGAPFISYTYKAIPAVVRNIARHPERVLGLVMAYEAANFAMLVREGMDPDAYLEVMDAYEDTLPPWDSGRSLWGARNFVVLPGADNLLALGRSHALGNPFMADAGDRQAAVPGVTSFWGSDIFGGNPMHALYDVLVNEDWRGKEIYDPGAPIETKRQKMAAYLWQSWSPSNIATPGSYHQTKVLEGLANDAREAPDSLAAVVIDAANGMAEALGFQQFTGLNRAGDEIESGDALLGSFGVKRRPIDTDRSVEFESARIDRDIREKDQHLSRENRLNNEGRKTDAQLEDTVAKVQADIDALIEQRDELLRARDTLQRHGLLDRQAAAAGR